MKNDKTIVYFHTGRGGRFYNSGHVTFCGSHDLQWVLNMCDSGKHWCFLQNRDEKGRFCTPYYSDQNGNFLISEKEAESGVGSLDWDGDYDADNCFYLEDCDENDLLLIADSNEFDKEDLIEEYFINYTDLKIDWSKFNGDYVNLIEEYFHSNGSIDIEEFYKEEV